MKKQIIIIGIIVLLIAVGLSGCNEKEEISLEGLNFIDEEYGLGFNPPEGWKIIDSDSPNTIIELSLTGNYTLRFTIYNPHLLENGETFDSYMEEQKDVLIESRSNQNLTFFSQKNIKINGMNAYELEFSTELNTSIYGPIITKWKKNYVEKNNRVFPITFFGQEKEYDWHISEYNESIDSLVII